MKAKLFVALELQYFELRIFSFNSYVYYVTRRFIASTRAFNLLTHSFNLLTGAFNLAARAFGLQTRGFELVTRVLLFHFEVLSLVYCSELYLFDFVITLFFIYFLYCTFVP